MSIERWQNVQSMMMRRDTDIMSLVVLSEVVHVLDVERHALLGDDGRTGKFTVVGPYFGFWSAGIAPLSCP